MLEVSRRCAHPATQHPVAHRVGGRQIIVVPGCDLWESPQHAKQVFLDAEPDLLDGVDHGESRGVARAMWRTYFLLGRTILCLNNTTYLAAEERAAREKMNSLQCVRIQPGGRSRAGTAAGDCH